MPASPPRAGSGNVDCEVTIIDRHNHHVFQPLLYQVATAGLSPGDIASPIRWILRKQPRLRVLLANVEHIDSSRDQRRFSSMAGDDRCRTTT